MTETMTTTTSKHNRNDDNHVKTKRNNDDNHVNNDVNNFKHKAQTITSNDDVKVVDTNNQLQLCTSSR